MKPKKSISGIRLKAADLLKNDDITRRFRKRNYRVQYEKCLDAVQGINEHCHYQFTTYNVPAMIPGEPFYDMDECIMYLKEELRKSDFYVRLMKPGNVLYISWRPQDVDKVQKRNEKQQKQHAAQEEERQRRREEIAEPLQREEQFEFVPESALSNLHLTTSLMMNNPAYDHLKSIQNLKRRHNH
jgi:hypothetical protein